MNEKLNHFDAAGNAVMVDVTGKGETAREAVAEGWIRVGPEAMRAKSMQITPRGMLSRGVSGIRGYTLIVNLPGSPKAVRENLEAILPALDHGIAILVGDAGECGGEEQTRL